jgi:hypothetical protein
MENFIFFSVLWLEPKTSSLLGKHFNIWTTPPKCFLLFYFGDKVFKFSQSDLELLILQYPPDE